MQRQQLYLESSLKFAISILLLCWAALPYKDIMTSRSVDGHSIQCLKKVVGHLLIFPLNPTVNKSCNLEIHEQYGSTLRKKVLQSTFFGASGCHK